MRVVTAPSECIRTARVYDPKNNIKNAFFLFIFFFYSAQRERPDLNVLVEETEFSLCNVVQLAEYTLFQHTCFVPKYAYIIWYVCVCIWILLFLIASHMQVVIHRVCVCVWFLFISSTIAYVRCRGETNRTWVAARESSMPYQYSTSCNTYIIPHWNLKLKIIQFKTYKLNISKLKISLFLYNISTKQRKYIQTFKFLTIKFNSFQLQVTVFSF